MDSRIIIIISTIVFICFLIFFVVLFIIQYQKRILQLKSETELMKAQFASEILKSQIEVQESTMSSLGRELHDNIGQLLSTTKMLLGLAERQLESVPDPIRIAQDTLGKALTELRALTKALNKEWLERFDLISNIQTEISRINTNSDLTITLKGNGNLVQQPSEQIILFRIIQEAIQNAIKHSECKTILLDIGSEGLENLVVIRDDGKGFDPGISGNGVGISNMKHRTHLLGGSITWASDKGTTVSIRIPISNETR